MIYHEIKPKNVLLDENKNIKLCDFGFCASIDEEKIRTTFCSTLQYLPPEIILNQEQTDKLDIWCLGVLMFELLHKRVPFENKNTNVYLEKIRKTNRI